MKMQIKIGIMGYGNLGKGVEYALSKCDDMVLAGIFTRRPPSSIRPVTAGVNVYHVDEAEKMRDQIDVMILCGGSATDLPEQGPAYARHFNTVDSFDTHAKIPDYFSSVEQAAKEGGNLSILSVGWDPGLFSISRLFMESILPDGATYTFWGKGVSQGHSDAIRRIPGVKNAIQYTIPVQEAIDKVRAGLRPELSAAEKHLRECFVVVDEAADKFQIEKSICEMPNYFADYHTTVHFVSEETLHREHSAMAHGGFVLHSGKTGTDTQQLMEYALKLGSNPEFTASVLVSYARAAYRLSKAGETGARSVFDIAPALLSPKSAEELRAALL